MAANMTRADLVAEAKNWIAQVAIAAHRHSPAQIKVAVEALEAFIDQLAANQAEGWISVEDRLPGECDRPYLVAAIARKQYGADSNYPGQGIRDVQQDWVIRRWPENFTHWCDLPAAPPIPSNGGAGEAL